MKFSEKIMGTAYTPCQFVLRIVDNSDLYIAVLLFIHLWPTFTTNQLDTCNLTDPDVKRTTGSNATSLFLI